MTITRLTLISHASTAALRAAAFPADEPLDDGGRADASALAGARRALLGAADLVGCGPERRAVETTRLLADDAGVTAAVDDGWRDWDLGRWRGRTWDEVGRDTPDEITSWMTDPAASPHGGESLDALLARAEAQLASSVDVGTVTHDGFARIVAVTHPAVIRAAIVVAIRATAESFWRIDIPPLSVTTLQHHGGRWTLRAAGRHEAVG